MKNNIIVDKRKLVELNKKYGVAFISEMFGSDVVNNIMGNFDVSDYNEKKIYIWETDRDIFKLHLYPSNENNTFAWISLTTSNCLANGTSTLEYIFNRPMEEGKLFVFSNLREFVKWYFKTPEKE